MVASIAFRRTTLRRQRLEDRRPSLEVLCYSWLILNAAAWLIVYAQVLTTAVVVRPRRLRARPSRCQGGALDTRGATAKANSPGNARAPIIPFHPRTAAHRPATVICVSVRTLEPDGVCAAAPPARCQDRVPGWIGPHDLSVGGYRCWICPAGVLNQPLDRDPRRDLSWTLPLVGASSPRGEHHRTVVAAYTARRNI